MGLNSTLPEEGRAIDQLATGVYLDMLLQNGLDPKNK